MKKSRSPLKSHLTAYVNNTDLYEAYYFMIETTKINQTFQAVAKKSFSLHCYTAWIQKLSLKAAFLSQENTEKLHITILADDDYILETINKNHINTIKKIIHTLVDPIPFFITLKTLQATLSLNDPNPSQTEPRSHKTYTFETFILGPSNQFAHAAAKAIVDEPGKSFNPLFFFGASGLGKTHLIRAIKHEVSQKYPERKTCYVPCEQFITDFTSFTSNERLFEFRKKYRDDIDIFLLDDVQFLSGKESIQEEFFFTFNMLYEQGKQIVVTSDKVPKDLTGLENRIRTRFEWGLIADIQPPDLETRIAILKTKVKLLNLTLSNEVINFLASHCTNNVREIEGALQKLKFASRLFQTPFTLESTKQLVKPFLKTEKVSYEIEQILNMVAKEYRCRVLELKSSIKARDISLPRHISMYLVRKFTDKSYPEIGFAFGGKDHTTVIHGVRKVSRLLSEDKKFRLQVEGIEQKLKNLVP